MASPPLSDALKISVNESNLPVTDAAYYIIMMIVKHDRLHKMSNITYFNVSRESLIRIS